MRTAVTVPLRFADGDGDGVVERVPTAVHLSCTNARYPTAEVVRSAHTLDLPFAG